MNKSIGSLSSINQQYKFILLYMLIYIYIFCSLLVDDTEWYLRFLISTLFHHSFDLRTYFPFVRSMWFCYEMRYFHGPLLGEGAYGEVYAMFHRSLGGQSNLGDRGGWASSWNDVTCSSDETFLSFFCSPPLKELKVGEYMMIMSLKMLVSNRSEPSIPYDIIYTCGGFSKWNSFSKVNHSQGIWGWNHGRLGKDWVSKASKFMILSCDELVEIYFRVP